MTKLTRFRLESLKDEGLYSDPECRGLYVQVTNRRGKHDGITRSWVYRFVSPIHKKSRCMGLGPCTAIDITEARELARAALRLVTLGADPIDYRNDKREQDRQEAIKERTSTVTFAHCVKQFLADKLPTFKSAVHARDYRETLNRACAAFGELNVKAVDTPTVTKFLEPMFKKTPVTAKRLAGRIEAVLDWATVHQFREGENPARWSGHLEYIFHAPTKQEPLAAMPIDSVPTFMAKLRQLNCYQARALEFYVLTAGGPRSNVVRTARWEHIDLTARLWTIPADNMKKGKEFIVPLSDAAVTLLEGLDKSGKPTFVFGNGKMDDKQMARQLRAAYDGPSTVPGKPTTVHGLRSTFRDWAGDRTTFDREVIEHSLAHKIKDRAEAAYRRTTAVEKRRLLLEQWATFCAGTAGADNVVALHRA
jgi:integrase